MPTRPADPRIVSGARLFADNVNPEWYGYGVRTYRRDADDAAGDAAFLQVELTLPVDVEHVGRLDRGLAWRAFRAAAAMTDELFDAEHCDLPTVSDVERAYSIGRWRCVISVRMNAAGVHDDFARRMHQAAWRAFDD